MTVRTNPVNSTPAMTSFILSTADAAEKATMTMTTKPIMAPREPVRNVVASISSITPRAKHFLKPRGGGHHDRRPHRQTQQQNLRHLVRVGELALLQEEAAAHRKFRTH